MNLNFPPIKKFETSNYLHLSRLTLKMCSRDTGSFMTQSFLVVTPQHLVIFSYPRSIFSFYKMYRKKR